jgi:hypothetical protein
LLCCGMDKGVRGVRELEGVGGFVVVYSTCACLMPCEEESVYYSVVDILNVTSGTWSTAALSQGRSGLAATSLPAAGVAIFAGGSCTSCDVFVWRVAGWVWVRGDA